MLETVARSPRQLQARWLAPDPANGVITRYTLRCTSVTQPLQSITVSTGNVLSFIVESLSPYTNYSCNVSASTGAGEGPATKYSMARTDESGLCCTVAVEKLQCFYLVFAHFWLYACGMHSVPDGPPGMFSATEVQAQQISFSWMPPAIPNGVITGYMLRYSNSTYNDSVTVKGLTSIVEFLNEYTEYRFELSASTRIGSGPSSSLTLTTAEAGMERESRLTLYHHLSFSLSLSLSLHPVPLHLLFPPTLCFPHMHTAPSAAPLNVTEVFNDFMSLIITWNEPPLEDQNGIIRGYNVTYHRTNSTGMAVRESTTNLMILINGLEPFTNYTVMVAAFTNDMGPNSQPITVRTDSAREFHHR